MKSVLSRIACVFFAEAPVLGFGTYLDQMSGGGTAKTKDSSFAPGNGRSYAPASGMVTYLDSVGVAAATPHEATTSPTSSTLVVPASTVDPREESYVSAESMPPAISQEKEDILDAIANMNDDMIYNQASLRVEAASSVMIVDF